MNKKKYFTSFMFSFCWKYRGKKTSTTVNTVDFKIVKTTD